MPSRRLPAYICLISCLGGIGRLAAIMFRQYAFCGPVIKISLHARERGVNLALESVEQSRQNPVENRMYGKRRSDEPWKLSGWASLNYCDAGLGKANGTVRCQCAQTIRFCGPIPLRHRS